MILYLVIPCYNEEDALPKSLPLINNFLESLINEKIISNESRIILIDDGSKDKTWKLIEGFAKTNVKIQGLRLSSNRGHQNALLAGLEYSIDKCDFTISMDVDLQDDPKAIREFITKAVSEKCEIVYGVRSSRASDSFAKKNTALFFYKLMQLLGVNIVYNHADYRMASNRALKYLAQYSETHLFLRGIFPVIGLKNDVVYYERNERIDGESKYPIAKMLSFAWNGITSFSIKPLRLISILGFICSILTFILSIKSFYSYMIGNAIPGWTSTILSIYFIGSVQLLSLGIIGEYIGKIFIEAKKRPRYFITDKTNQ